MKETLDFYTKSLDCVHCGLCLPACPTYSVLGLETDSPRGRLYLMRAMAEGRIDDVRNIRPYLDRCLDCRACETACPSGVKYGEILETARSHMEATRPAKNLGARIRRFLLWHVVAHRGRLRLAFDMARVCEIIGLRWLASRLRLIPKSLAQLGPRTPAGKDRLPLVGFQSPKGKVRGRVTLFTGCVMEHLFGHVNRATVRLLLANGFEVDIPHSQVCCGALLVHNGQADRARTLARRNIAAFRNATVVIHNSAGCGAAMKEYGPLLGTDEGADLGGRCQDITEFLAERGLTAEPRPLPLKVAYDDPCHLCHGQGIRQQPRQLLSRVPGLQLVDHADPESCCGSAGIYNLLQPKVAGEIGRGKAESLLASGADAVITGNPGCMLQIQGHLRALGSSARVIHPVELLLPPD